MAHGLVNAFIKNAQIDIQKCITWLKKSERESKLWNKHA